MSEKKILHISHTDIHIDSRILKEMEALAAEGYDVRGIGISQQEGFKRSDLPLNISVMTISLRTRGFRRLPKTLKHTLSLFELCVKVLPLAIRQKPVLVHCHDTLMLPIAALVKLITRASLIYDAHELESDRGGISKVQGWLTISVERLLWRFVDALIVVSPSIQRWYNDNLGEKNLSSVILNAPKINEEMSLDSDYLRDKYNIPRDSKVYIYVGYLGPGRGIDLIVSAFTFPIISSHVVFLGYGELADQLKEVSRRHSNIHVHDAVSHTEVVHVVRSADFGICLIENSSLSDYFCLPNKLFEYAFAGILILGSNFPDIRQILSEYEIGETCDLNVDSICSTILRLEGCGSAFRPRDLTQLGWPVQSDKLINLYRQIL